MQKKFHRSVCLHYNPRLKYMVTFIKRAISVIRAAVRISTGPSDFALK